MFKAGDFWQYSSTVYASPGVKELCLLLQDEHGFNVNLLLLCTYLNLNMKGCSLAQFERVLSAIADSDSAVQAHRKMRRAAKMLDEAKYKELLGQELEMEKQQQKILIDSLNAERPQNCKSNNLETYCKALKGRKSDNISPLLEDLIMKVKFAPTGRSPSD